MSGFYEVGADGWLVGVERRPHPPGKRYSADNAGVGMAWHSMEGSYAGSMSVLDSGTGGSWKFSVRRDGSLVQHCPVQCSCWASGNALANTMLWATENEGVAGQPLTEAQVRTCLRLIRTWERYTGRKATRDGGWGSGRTMHEHREVATLITPNAGPTACPSERYAPLWAALEEDEMALREEVDKLKVALFAGSERRGMSFEEKLRLANWYIDETIGEKRQSMADVAASAIAVVGQLAREVARGGDADIDVLEQMADLFERNASELRALRDEKR